MQKNAPPRPSSDTTPLIWGGAAILVVTAWRLAMLPLATADLFVDELQYWQWGQALDWGYFSKPPLIGWVLRLVTDLAGSDSAFWIRMVGAVFHAATALILMLGARRFTSAAGAAIAGVIYATLPLVAVGSFLISTDTILLPFFALAVVLYMRLVDRPSLATAAAMGVAIGCGMMAKYAAIYFWMGVALGAVMVPQFRIRWSELAIAVAAFLLVISPNIIWNLQNDLMTVSHTADNVDWVNRSGLTLHPDKAGEFFGAQFGVMGPVFFAAFLWLSLRAIFGAQLGPRMRWLAWMSLPILLLVTTQALLSRAYANWAATAYVAAVLLVAPVMWHQARRWLWVGLAVNIAITLAVPIAMTQTETLRAGEQQRLVLRRFVDRKVHADRILEFARANGYPFVVAENRDLLAELFHAARDMDIDIWAAPTDGRPIHFYQQVYSLPSDQSAPFAYVMVSPTPLPCAPVSETPLAEWTARDGGFKSAAFFIHLMPADCFAGADQSKR